MPMLVHKAVEVDNLTRKGQRALQDLLDVRRQDALILPKLDGVYAQFLFGGRGWHAWSRTGEPMPSLETPERMAQLHERGDGNRAYVGEAWIPATPHSVINGAARRKQPQPELQFYLHDSFNLPSVYNLKADPMPWDQRMAKADVLLSGTNFDRVYGLGLDSLLRIGTVDEPTIEALVDHAKSAVKAAYQGGGSVWDGLILRDNTFGFWPGAGKDGGIYKLKPRMSLDLRVVGQHAEVRDTKLGGYLTVEFRGVRTDVGSGLTQDMLRKMLDRGDTPETGNYMYAIAEVEFLDFTAAGALREPVLKAIRFDKENPDA